MASYPTLRAKYVTQVGQHDINLEARGIRWQGKCHGSDNTDKTLSIKVGLQKINPFIKINGALTAKKYFNNNVSVDGRLGFGDDYNSSKV